MQRFSSPLFSILTLLLLHVVLFQQNLTAQPTLQERVIPIKSYDVREVGLYPSDVTEGPENTMAILQYWPSDPFHPAENFYLQLHRLEDYSLKWGVPVTVIGREPMEVGEMQGLEKSFAVIGRQYVPKEKRIVSVARFFDMEGKCANNDPVIISTYRGKPGKDLAQQTMVSPNKKCMLWEGRDGNDYYASAWTSEGRQLWAESFEVPHLGKYKIDQSSIADDGTLYLLLTKSKQTLSMKDTLYPPLLLAYDARKKSFMTDTVVVDSAFDTHAWLSVLPTGEPVVAGVWSRGPASKTVLHYGGKNKEYWAGFFMQRNRLADGVLSRDTVHQDSMPASWLEEFGVVGARFGNYKLIVDPDKARRLILVAEEVFVNDVVEYGPLGLIAFDPLSGRIAWDAVMDKKQRDRSSDRFLSYLPKVARGKLNLVYLSEMGAPGKVMVTSFSLRDGSSKETVMADNFDSSYLFLPQSSGSVNGNEVVLVGLGEPTHSNFKFLRISF